MIYTSVILIVHLLVVVKINHTLVTFRRQAHLEHSFSRRVGVRACDLFEINVAVAAAAAAYPWCPT